MPSARASASQFSKGAGPPAGCVPNPPCHTQSSTTHRPVYRPQDEEFERYDDDISIAVPHAARPAPSLLGSPSPHIPLSLAPQGAVELYQPRTSDGHAPQAAHEHNLSDGITAPRKCRPPHPSKRDLTTYRSGCQSTRLSVNPRWTSHERPRPMF